MDDPKERPGRFAGEIAAVPYIVTIALIAKFTALFFLLFPELGALSYDILKRPAGTWARAPVMLVVTPFLTAAAGTIITRNLAYGPIPVLLTIGSAMAIVRLLRSPIAPAISAGLLPLTLGVTDWRYPPSILIGTGLLAGVAAIRSRMALAEPAPATEQTDDELEATPADYGWVPWFLGFLAAALALVSLTGWRFILFPPLVVIGFEMFAHADVCPWAKQPLRLPLACMLTACGGLLCLQAFGAGPLAAGLSVAIGIAVLRLLRLHVPPAIAVGLLPLVMTRPGIAFPLAVGIGTSLLVASFLLWRGWVMARARISGAS
jgi:hypothetical protein